MSISWFRYKQTHIRLPRVTYFGFLKRRLDLLCFSQKVKSGIKLEMAEQNPATTPLDLRSGALEHIRSHSLLVLDANDRDSKNQHLLVLPSQ